MHRKIALDIHVSSGTLHIRGQEINDLKSSAGVESSCGFVKEENVWLNNQLHRDVTTLLLTSRHTALQLCPNLEKQLNKYIKLLELCSKKCIVHVRMCIYVIMYIIVIFKVFFYELVNPGNQ